MSEAAKQKAMAIVNRMLKPAFKDGRLSKAHFKAINQRVCREVAAAYRGEPIDAAFEQGVRDRVEVIAAEPAKQKAMAIVNRMLKPAFKDGRLSKAHFKAINQRVCRAVAAAYRGEPIDAAFEQGVRDRVEAIAGCARRGGAVTMALLSSPEFTDLLFVIARNTSEPHLIYRLRRICRVWRDAIDAVAPTSPEWQALLVAHKVAAGRFAAGASFQAAIEVLVCEPRRLVRDFADRARRPCDDAGMAALMDALLNFFRWLVRVAHLAATQWLVEINDALPRTQEIEFAFALVPTLVGRAAYDFWAEQSDSLARHIAQHHLEQAAPVETRQKAVASFESFTRKMTLRCLFRLNSQYPIDAINVRATGRLRAELALGEGET